MDKVSIVIASISLVVAITSFTINYIFSKMRLFYDVYTNYTANDNAQMACREVKIGLAERDLENSAIFEVHLDQFLMFINTLLRISESIFIKKQCRKLITYELNVIISSQSISKNATLEKNHLDYLKRYIEERTANENKKKQ